MMKKQLTVCLATVMILAAVLLGAVGMTASAATTDGLLYAVSGGKVEIRGYTGNESVLEIPSKIEGYSVTAIQNKAFYECTSLTTVTFPDTLIKIGQEAFYGCTSLKEVVFSDALRTIENGAFYGCTSLKSITLPPRMTNIGGAAFCKCSALESVTLPEVLQSIEYEAFAECTSLTSITLPDMLSEMDWDVFYGCTAMIAFEVKETNSRFTAVDGVLFDKQVKTLLQYPCGKADASYTIPDSVKTIHERAFCGNVKLTNVTVPGNVETIGTSAFSRCTSLTNVTICEGVTSIEYNAFFGCTTLTNIVFPKSVMSIGSYAFMKCTSLKSIALPENIRVIAEWTFWGCTSLESVAIPNTVIRIDEYAFRGCGSLTDITIPDRVTSISEYAFYECKSLADIAIPDGVTTIGQYAFYGCTSLSAITVPDGVTDIGHCAFYGCTSLAEITLPSSVTSIGNHVFKECSSLNAIVIPNSVTSMGYSVFSDCTSLKSVTLPSGLTSVGYNQFYDCRSLTAVTIPNGVTSIGENAFRYCMSLTSITLPHSVTSIGKYAFYDCSKLANVYYAGSKEDKKAIIIDGYNAQLTDAIWHFNGCDGNYTNVCDASCNTCGAVRTASHTYKTTVTKATLAENGSAVKRCAVCGKLASKYTVKSPQTFKLSATSYTYDGKVKAPTVTVKDTAGKTLKKGTHYTVTYASGRKNVGTYKVTVKMIGNYSGTKTLSFKINPIKISTCKLSLSATAYTYNGYAKTPSVKVKNANGTTLQKGTHYTVTYASGRKNVGTYKVTVKMKGNYSGTKTLTFKINPPKTSVAKLTAGTKAITVSITKKTSQVSGYQIQYATSKSFANATTKTVSSYTTTKYTLKSLKAGKTYYVRVRTYKTLNGKKVYSDWSAAKSAKVK